MRVEVDRAPQPRIIGPKPIEETPAQIITQLHALHEKVIPGTIEARALHDIYQREKTKVKFEHVDARMQNVPQESDEDTHPDEVRVFNEVTAPSITRSKHFISQELIRYDQTIKDAKRC